MSDTPRKRGGWRRIAEIAFGVFLALVVVAGGTFYKAYEPFVTGPFGWAAIPEGPYPSSSQASLEWTEAGARADDWLDAARAELGAPALSAAVSVNGEIVWTGVTGYADLVDGIEASPETAFRIGSSSKPVTSIAMGTLLAQDKVDLDAPVSTYMPEIAAPFAAVTTRQAMGHQAGVPDYGVCLCFPVIEYFNTRHFETTRDALRTLEGRAPLFAPGEAFTYSSNGYNLAGGVIESVSGQRFAEFLEQAVFAPLGMDGSRADSGIMEAEDATFYDVSRPGLYKEVFRVDNTIKLPSGGILSTPSDMVRLGQQMIEPTLFDAETRDLLMRRQTLADGSPSPQGYALGWRYGEEIPLGAEITTARLSHNGVALGSISYFNVFPEHGLVVSVMMNTMDAPGKRSVFEHGDALSAMFVAEIEARAARP